MQVLYLDAPFAEKIQLCPETIAYLQKKKYKKVALFTSIQFLKSVESITEQLSQIRVKAITSLAARASQPGQLLGCDCSLESLNLPGEVDAFLYVGDGNFHPLALAYAQKDLKEFKEVVCNDPLQNKMTLLDVSAIKKNLLRARGSLMKFLSAKTVGVIITVKPGQQQYRAALALEKKYPEKKFYYFADDKISFDQLENFPFIEVWVNTACPRVGFDDWEQFRKSVVNLEETLQAEKSLKRAN